MTDRDTQPTDVAEDGCPSCRLVTIRMLRRVELPRFPLDAGETWNVPERKFDADGSITDIGAGVIPAGSYEVIGAERATGCCPMPPPDDEEPTR